MSLNIISVGCAYVVSIINQTDVFRTAFVPRLTRARPGGGAVIRPPPICQERKKAAKKYAAKFCIAIH